MKHNFVDSKQKIIKDIWLSWKLKKHAMFCVDVPLKFECIILSLVSRFAHFVQILVKCILLWAKLLTIKGTMNF